MTIQDTAGELRRLLAAVRVAADALSEMEARNMAPTATNVYRFQRLQFELAHARDELAKWLMDNGEVMLDERDRLRAALTAIVEKKGRPVGHRAPETWVQWPVAECWLDEAREALGGGARKGVRDD